jgi:hypothetical protein
MLALGYKEFWWLFPHQLCHGTCYAGFEALRLYLLGGCTCHTHARPYASILAALDRVKIDKIWVHLRNPAESVVSAYHHYRGEGHGEGTIAEERQRTAATEAAALGINEETDKDQFVAAQIDWFVDWVGLWIQQAKVRPDKIVFSFHRELADLQSFFARVFHEFEIDFHDNVSAEPLPHDRFRKKESDDWRCGLSLSTQRLLEDRVRARLADFPAFEKLWT